MTRVSGYHYVTLKSGRRKRVYSRGGIAKKAKGTTHRRRNGGYPNDVIMGYGAYRFAGRRSGKNIREPGIPRVQNSNRGVIVRHKEFLTDVPSSIGFTSVVYPLNPGIDGSFPWLSRVAQNFEEWLPRGIIIEYRTTSSDTLLAANPALGSVIIATQYNSVNADFVNKQQMENYQGAISCKPSVSMIHQVETKRSQTQMDEFYIRTTAPPDNADLRLYDLGKVQVATVGSQANGNIIGELWISYEIELRKPKIPGDPLTEAAHILLTAAGTTGETPAIPAGTNAPSNVAGIAAGSGTQPLGGWTPTAGSTMADARFNRNAALFGGASYIQLGQFARGFYLITCSFPWVTPGSQGAFTITAQSGGTIASAWANNTLLLAQEVDAGTATAATTNVSFIVNVTAAFATFSITSNSTATGGFNVGADVYIAELPDTLN